MTELTIGIPTKNRPDFLRETLKSLRDQSCDQFEVVISDNNSDASTYEVVNEAGLKNVSYFKFDANVSLERNWNNLIRMSSGKFFLLLSDDDLLSPNAVEEILALLQMPEEEETFGAICLATRKIDVTGKPLPYEDPIHKITNYGKVRIGPALVFDYKLVSWLFLTKRFEFYICSTVLKKSDILKFGGFDFETFGYSLDIALIIKIIKHYGNVLILSSAHSSYRLHQTNLTNQVDFQEWEIGFKNFIKLFESSVSKENERLVLQNYATLLKRRYFCLSVDINNWSDFFRSIAKVLPHNIEKHSLKQFVGNIIILVRRFSM
jgi:glycosyltransferase involved in cell wall biosynthesis